MPERETNVLLQVFVSGQLAAELLRRELRESGLSPDQFAVESMIAVRGPITPTELAARLGMAPTTLSSWLRRLTAAGRVRRRPNPADGRSVLIDSSARGRRAVEAAAPHFVAALQRVEAELGPDLSSSIDHGDRLHQALRRALDAAS